MSKSQSPWEKMRKVTTMKHPNVLCSNQKFEIKAVQRSLTLIDKMAEKFPSPAYDEDVLLQTAMMNSLQDMAMQEKSETDQEEEVRKALALSLQEDSSDSSEEDVATNDLANGKNNVTIVTST